MENINSNILRSVFTVSNQSNNFIVNSSIAYNNNITTALNQQILLKESYFIVEYQIGVTAGQSTRLCPNWFLSMISSLNFQVGSISQQISTTSQARTMPEIGNLNRIMNYNTENYNNLSQISDSSIISINSVTGGNTLKNFIQNPGRVYSNETAGARVYRDYILLKLEDIIPLIDSSPMTSGLISFNMNLVFDSNTQITSAQKPFSFEITKINFHYSILEMSEITNLNDYEIQPVSSYSIISGVIPQIYNFSLSNSIAGQLMEEIFYGNLQLTQNRVKYLIICPYFRCTSDSAKGKKICNNNVYAQNSASTLVLGSQCNTPIGSIGSPFIGYKNIKVTINGAQIAPCNLAMVYDNSQNAEWYNFNFSFLENNMTNQKNNVSIPFDIYRDNFKPIIVNLSEYTKRNQLNQTSFQFTLYNLYDILSHSTNTSDSNIDLQMRVNYYIVADSFYNQ